MIAASEPFEFAPRGRSLVNGPGCHPGPLVKKTASLPNEFILLEKLQNVNISKDIVENEFWIIRENYETVYEENGSSSSDSDFLRPYLVNSEDELYVKGNTAVWTKGQSDSVNRKSTCEICFTCDSTIQFGFFCTENFLNAEYKIEETQQDTKKSQACPKNDMAIGLIDSTSLKVYSLSGENLVTAIESPISHVWVTKYCVLIEKEASRTTIDSYSVPMPRLFSIAHPLDDMFPLLVKVNLIVNYFTEAEYKIIFTSDQSDYVLLFDTRNAKHFICKLRKATIDETLSVFNLFDTTATPVNSMNRSSMAGLTNLSMHPNSTANNSFKMSHMTRHSLSGMQRTFTPIPSPSPAIFNMSVQSPCNSYRANLACSMPDIHSTMHKSSISMQARKIGECEPSKPLVPDLILEQVWMESATGTWNEYHEMASSGFLHTDMIGQKFLCFLLVKSCMLNMLNIDNSALHKKPIFGSISSVAARDAVALNRMNLIAILTPCGTLMLYSGPLAVGKVHVGGILATLSTAPTFNSSFSSSFPRRSSLLPTVVQDNKFEEDLHMLQPCNLSPVQPLHPLQSPRFSNCLSIRDPAGNRLSLELSNGNVFRFSVPPICESSIVQKCLSTMRQVLPKEMAIKFLIKWYGVRNAPGSRDFSIKKEWELFKNMCFDLIGRPFPKSTSSATFNASGGPKKRRKSDNTSGSNSDWEYLLAAEQSINKEECGDQEMTLNYNCEAQLFSHIPMIIFSLHLLYEELKLDSAHEADRMHLSEFLYQLSLDFKLENYRLHYFKDNPQLIYLKTNASVTDVDSHKMKNIDLVSANGEVLNIFNEIYEIVNDDDDTKIRIYPYIENVNTISKMVIQVSSFAFMKIKTLDQCINYMKLHGNNVDAQKREDHALILFDCQDSIHTKIIKILHKFGITRRRIERFPLSLHYILSQILETARLFPPIGCSAEVYELLLRPELFAHASFKKDTTTDMSKCETSLTPRVQTQPDVIAKSEKAIVEDDGMEHIVDTKLLRLRFQNDLRINEVKKSLNSSKPVSIDIVQSPNVSDHEFIEEQEKQLFALCTRTMALPIGRGMFTFRTYYPISTELLPIPKLCLTGKESGRGATIELQQIEVPPNMSFWPLFHNGVAAGLRIATEPKDIDPTWIIYNKPKDLAEIPPSYAGFLMSLGLTSSLKSLPQTYVYDYLIRSEELVSVALLLGISATYRGTQDSKITRMLSIHVESLLPPTAIELDVSHNIQVAALLGIGLLYQNTVKRHIAEALLQEIGRPPGPEMENYMERESYALSAGLALGMVTLGKGSQDVGLDDLQIPDTLHYYMIGGSKRMLSGAQKEKYKLPSFQIREGDQVNIDVTAPGATLALGLMFFRSDNQAVADWMKPPETMYLLDFVRPDLLMLRVLSRGLILWDSVEASNDWINAQIPKSLSKIIKDRPDPENDDLDHEAICQAYCNIVTGAAMSIGLRFAGTQDPVAYKTLRKIIIFFLSANGQYIGEYAGKSTVESCVTLVLLALSLVFAGTGSLNILRMIRMTRSRIGPTHTQVTYGSHMAIHMALGFLFLGAGRYTLSRTPEAIAALICALFPKFPTHSNDNRYHLQAFRHLYVLAVEPRLFLPRDIDSGKLCLSTLKYVEIGKSEVTIMAPCMLPELSTLQCVFVDDPNYWPVCFKRGRNWDQFIKLMNANGCIDIKQRAGRLSHLDDPNRIKSIFAETLTTEDITSWKLEPKNLLSFSNDKFITNFTNKMLVIPKFHQVEGLNELSSTEEDIRQLLLMQAYDSLTRDKMHAMPMYAGLLALIGSLQSNTSNSCSIWQIKIISVLNNKYPQVRLNRSDYLLSPEIVNPILLKYQLEMEKKRNEMKFLLRNFLIKKDINFLQEFCLNALEKLTDTIIFYDLPLELFTEGVKFDKINYLDFMLAMKRKKQPLDTEFALNVWKLMKD